MEVQEAENTFLWTVNEITSGKSVDKKRKRVYYNIKRAVAIPLG
jgi:hypothetical protein